MAKFREAKSLQKFAAAHASIHNHFNQDRHLNRRDIFKQTAPPPWPSGVNKLRESRVRVQSTNSHLIILTKPGHARISAADRIYGSHARLFRRRGVFDVAFDIECV